MLFERDEYRAGKFISKHLKDLKFIKECGHNGLVVSYYTLNADGRDIEIRYYSVNDSIGAWEDGNLIFCGYDEYHTKQIVEYIKDKK